ncbi:unnamed protein product [Camellia sinensis]
MVPIPSQVKIRTLFVFLNPLKEKHKAPKGKGLEGSNKVNIKGFIDNQTLPFNRSSMDSVQYSIFSIIQLPPNATGPESVGFNSPVSGPYVGVADGRVLKRQDPILRFVDFAVTSPNRTKQLCDGTTDPDMGPICGRPLGFSFDSANGKLYIVDAYFGLLVVGPNGGLATQLATSAEGVPFKFLDGVDVDQFTGLVYFSDARNISQPNFKPDSTGRLLTYDPKTNQVKVLLRGLSGAGGPAVSVDSSFVLVGEYVNKRIQKYWLTGDKANTAEIFLALPGNPSKIKKNIFGEFWVAVDITNQQPTRLTTPVGIRFDDSGKVMQQVNFTALYNNLSISVVQEQNSALYIGCRFVNFVGVFT